MIWRIPVIKALIAVFVLRAGCRTWGLMLSGLHFARRFLSQLHSLFWKVYCKMMLNSNILSCILWWHGIYISAEIWSVFWKMFFFFFTRSLWKLLNDKKKKKKKMSEAAVWWWWRRGFHTNLLKADSASSAVVKRLLVMFCRTAVAHTKRR